MAAVPSEELRTVLLMSVILITVNFKFRNRSTCSKGPMKRAGKVCGDSQDLKSPGGEVGAILIRFLFVFFFADYPILDKLFELCPLMQTVLLH